MATDAFTGLATGAMLVAVVMALRLRRGTSFRRRLVSMEAAAQHPSRRLVEVLRPLRTSRTGQLLVVIDASTGHETMVWLPLAPRLKSGDLALLVWMSDRWLVMDRLPVRPCAWPPVVARADHPTSTRTVPTGWYPREGDVVREAERYLGWRERP